MVKQKNYLTDFRDRYAGRPKTALKNIAITGVWLFLILWALSLLGITSPPTKESFIGFVVAVFLAVSVALLIRYKWPKQN